MPITRCPNGHYYDDSRFASCPHCSAFTAMGSAEATAGASSTAAAAFGGFAAPDDEKTVSKFPAGKADDEKTERFDSSDDYEKTIGLMKGTLKFDPVVGWLVCVEGAERGRDYRIHSGRNFIGRTWKMDINIVDDRTVSRENHASVVFEPHKAEFMIVNGESVKTYLNGTPVTAPMPLTEGDRIGIGDSVYELVAYCKGGRSWL